jgi:NAD+ diphosphatase
VKQAETVTFGGGGLDRADTLRTDGMALAKLRTSGEARAIVFWRGKPMVDTTTENLHALPTDHPILTHAKEPPLFLGISDGVPVFSYDISSWEPIDIDPQAIGQFFDPSVNRHPSLPEEVVFAELRSVMAQLSPLDAELAAAALGLHNWHRAHRFCAKCGTRSDINNGGWQRVCPECDTHHFPRTDPVVIMLITRDEQVLLGRSPHWPTGMYSLLAGFMEPGETLEGAVRREVFEEAGITVGAVDYLASQPWPFPSSLMIGCRGKATSSAISLDEKELEDALWVSKEDLIDVMTGRNEHMKASRKGSIARFLVDRWLADTLD